MIIMFLGTSGVHHPLVAANIFLDRLKGPDFRFTNGFADSYHDKSGKPIFVDEDRYGNQVYCLGVGPQVEIGRRSIEDLTRILGFGPEDLLIKTVYVRGDNLIYYLGKLSNIPVGSYINMSISGFLIKRNFDKLKKQIENLQNEIYPV